MPVYDIRIQYINLLKRYRMETIFVFCTYGRDDEVERGHNSHNNLWILPLFKLGLYFMIIYLCIKYESNIVIFSHFQKIWKPFSHVQTYGQRWYYIPLPHPHNWKWRGCITKQCTTLTFKSTSWLETFGAQIYDQSHYFKLKPILFSTHLGKLSRQQIHIFLIVPRK